ncbi:hypothetical protein FACS1894178_0440 [Bacteroidia bacterium]|nr:hypothetical protein FACS1894178_0440 [Bacteroidia bacterium]
MKNIQKFSYKVEIEIDENAVFKKYPNYKYNFVSPKELADHIIACLQDEGGCDMSKDGMENFGYSIKAIEL